MIIGEKNYEKIVVTTNSNEPIMTFTDKDVTLSKGYSFELIPTSSKAEETNRKKLLELAVIGADRKIQMMKTGGFNDFMENFSDLSETIELRRKIKQELEKINSNDKA